MTDAAMPGLPAGTSDGDDPDRGQHGHHTRKEPVSYEHRTALK
jgi:hypothetical protein